MTDKNWMMTTEGSTVKIRPVYSEHTSISFKLGQSIELKRQTVPQMREWLDQQGITYEIRTDRRYVTVISFGTASDLMLFLLKYA